MSGLSVCVILCCNRVRFFGSFLREWGFSCCLFEKFGDFFAIFSVFFFEVFYISFDFLNFFCSVVGFFFEVFYVCFDFVNFFCSVVVFLFEVFFVFFDFVNFFCSVVGFFDEFGDVDFGYCSVCCGGISTFYSKGSDFFLFFYAVFSNGGRSVRRFREKFGK